MLAACGEPGLATAPTPDPHRRFDLAAPLLFNEEEIIGDPIYGVDTFYHHYSGHDYALYKVSVEPAGAMYYNGHLSYNHWGWFTTKGPDCTHGEVHDADGDGVVDGGTEAHCAQNGDYTVNLWHLYYTNGIVDSQRVIFRRRVILLDTLGAWTDNPGSGFFHDVRVAFDSNPATTTLTGDIRAGYAYVPRMNWSLDPSYTPDAHEVNVGDSLWLISTFVANGNGSRPWYNNKTGALTSFNQHYDRVPSDFGPGVNSLPVDNGPTPILYTFVSPGGTSTYQVVGRVTEPYHDGINNLGRIQTASSIYVTVYAVHACFNYSGSLQVGQPVTFDASCSTGTAPLEYSWNFGDNPPPTSWSTSATTPHTYTSAGTFDVVLSARRVVRPADADDSTRSVTITPGLSAYISGPDLITASGNYSWDTYPSGGTPPYHYHWHYKQGGTETDVGTDSPTYTRYVLARTSYVFRLRDSVTDAASNLAQPIYWVDVVPGGGGGVPLGLLDAAGTCVALPASSAGRQAAHEAIAAAGRWPLLCQASKP